MGVSHVFVCVRVWAGTRLGVKMLGFDLEANSRDNQLMIRLMVGALEDSCVKQAGSKFRVNKD